MNSVDSDLYVTYGATQELPLIQLLNSKNAFPRLKNPVEKTNPNTVRRIIDKQQVSDSAKHTSVCQSNNLALTDLDVDPLSSRIEGVKRLVTGDVPGKLQVISLVVEDVETG